MTNTWSLLRIAVRGLRRSPGFTAAVVLSLALGIGANSTIFSIVNAVLLRPLPYPQPDELVRVALGSGSTVRLPAPTSYLEPLSESSHTLVSLAGYDRDHAVVAGTAAPEYVPGAIASPRLAEVLGVPPVLGRFLAPGDREIGATPAVVIGYALWQRQFGGDSLVIDRTIRIDDQPVRVVGVMPPGFDFPSHAEFWQPFVKRPAGAGGLEIAEIVARARPGVGLAQVQRDLAGIVLPADPTLPKEFRDADFVVMSLHDQLFGSSKAALAMLSVAVALLLLIACANVANLVMARTLRRRQEFAVRAALGAGRVALVRHILAECLLLATAGGAVGAFVSVWVTRLFVSLSPKAVADAGHIGVDGSVVLFTMGVSIVVGLIVGSGPAILAVRETSAVSLGEGGARGGSGRFALAVRRTLVVAQMAIAVVLLTGAGLLLKSLSRVTSVDIGFEPDHLTSATIALPYTRYPDAAGAQAFRDELALRLRALPGVQSVAFGRAPLSGMWESVIGKNADGTEAYRIGIDAVGPGYFGTYRIPLRAGRDLASSDNASAPVVAVINATAARVVFPNGNVLGQVLTAVTIRKQHPVVVGVSADVPQYDVAMAPLPEAYIPTAQLGLRPSTVTVRFDGRAETIASLLRREVGVLDSDLALQLASPAALLSASVAPHRFTSILLGAFAGLALALAALGLFGVVAYLATQRTRELGVRTALGAQRWSVVALVMREGVACTAAGVALGVVLALVLSRLLTGLLYDVLPRDPGIITAAGLTLAVVGVAAAFVPARRASRVDPLIALRAD